MNHRILASLAAGALMLGGWTGVSLAQNAAPHLASSGCSQAPTAPATPAQSGGSASGTAPGNSGSTGWSGSGLGGAFNGTSQAGPVASSPSFQPVTAKGLDPIKGMANVKKASC